MPVRDTRSFGHAATTDLYTGVGLDFSNNLINDYYRVTGIKHTITTDKWLVEYDFGVDSAVASPTVQPSPVGTGDVTHGTWVPVTFAGIWVNYGSGYASCCYMRKDGIVYLKGLAKSGSVNTTIFTLPVGYRPAEVNIYVASAQTKVSGAASTGTAHTHTTNDSPVRLQINTDGTVATVNAGASGYQSLSGISFPVEA